MTGKKIESAGSLLLLKEPEDSRQKDEWSAAERYLDFTKEIIVAIDLDEKITHINRAGCETLGIRREEIFGENWFEMFVPENLREDARSYFRRLIFEDGYHSEHFESYAIGSESHEKIISWHIAAFADESGNTIGVLGSGEDITELVVMKGELSQQMAYTKGILDNAPDMILVLDRRWKITYANNTLAKFAGMKTNEVVGKELMSVVKEAGILNSKSVKILSARMKEWLQTGKPISDVELDAIDKNGEEFSFSYSTSVIKGEDGDVIGEFVIIRDITESKKVKEVIEESEEKYSSLVELSPDAIMMISEAKIVFCNSQYYKMLGIEDYDVVGKSVFELLNGIMKDSLAVLTKDERQKIVKNLKDAARGVVEPRRYQIPARRSTGEMIWVEIYVTPITYKKKTAEMILVRDITESKRAEEITKIEHQKYQEVVENIDEGLFNMDLKGRVRLINPKIAEKVTGYDMDEIEGKSLTMLAPKEEMPAAISVIQKVLGGNKIRNFETVLKKKDGTIVPFLMSLTPKMKDGKIYEIFGVVNDISEKKNAEEKARVVQERYKTVVENIGEGLFIQDATGVINYVNPEIENITGYSARELIGSNFANLLSKDVRKIILPGFGRLMKGETLHNLDINFTRKDGEEIFIEITITPYLKKGKITEITGVIRDITERKESEAILNKTLSDLKHTNKELEQFAYVASHDLQEPLRMVGSYVQLISRRYKGRLDDDADEFIEYAVDGARRMQNMINDLLTYSRVGTRGSPFKQINCEEIIRNVTIDLSILIEENNASITHDPLPVVWADEVQLIQLFSNLIGNSIKYRREDNPKVHISVEKSADNWLFSVQDNGMGIDSVYKENIFNVFSRMDKRQSGTGIGLAVCMKIVKRHGGNIWVKSELNKGSTFYFTIPTRRKFDDEE
ncbi:MAG: PAS domain S-box protein [Halobacteriota archaeon]|nr:PAS domain S-box protein [Halobacteriota archaeon]